MPSVPILAGLILLLATVAALLLLARRRLEGTRLATEHEDAGLPFLVVPPGLAARASAPASASAAPPTTAPAIPPSQATTAVRSTPAALPGAPAKPTKAVQPPAPRPAVPASPGDLEDDTTLQLLPGRLEVLSGGNGKREIRFLRLPGLKTEVTIGRSHGDPHRHVRLAVPTVSRVHAAMQFDGSRWSIENRSETNPIVVRGTPLAGSGRSALADGDLVEMGEVILRFRSR